MPHTLSDQHFLQALAALDSPEFSDEEKVQMLMQTALTLQTRPPSPKQLYDAVVLYDKALSLCPPTEILQHARMRALKASALQMIPDHDSSHLEEARKEIESALPVLEASGEPEELAEVHMHLGLILQALASANKARITEAIVFYQKALLTFGKESFPTEFAILHNNLATAYLSIPLTGEKAKMREALAVQSYQAALEVITLENDPSEYAMLQNNLGNALQYAASGHPVENNLRALKAYDEALRVRNARLSPLPYANTISNKANCLLNLPDAPGDSGNAQLSNRLNLAQAKTLYLEAREIFREHGEKDKASMIDECLGEIQSQLDLLGPYDGDE